MLGLAVDGAGNYASDATSKTYLTLDSVLVRKVNYVKFISPVPIMEHVFDMDIKAHISVHS